MRVAVGILLSSFALASCQAASSPGAVVDRHTGLNAYRSASFKSGRSDTANLTATAIHEGELGYGVMIHSDASAWQFYRQAWSNGKQLRFTRLGGRVDACAPSCHMTESGFIYLSPEEFSAAARDGFDFKLIGQRAIEGRVPAEAFQQVLR